MKRFLALALSLLMILSVLLMAGCSDGTTDNGSSSSSSSSSTTSTSKDTTASTGESTESTSDSTSESTESTDSTTESTESSSSSSSESTEDTNTGTTVEPTGKEKLQGYEDVTFNGATFTIVGADGVDDGFNSAKEIYSEESDAISVAVRERNAWIETLYQCKIVGKSSPTPASDAMTEVSSNQHTIDLYTHHYANAGTATGGKVYNLYDLGSRDIDFSKVWWDQQYINSYSVKNSSGKDTLYSIVGDFALTTFDCTHAIVFNKTVFQNDPDINSIDIYELVRTNKWTMDQFQFMVKNAASDADGNSTLDSQAGDILGWIRTGHATHGLHTASGLSIMKNTAGVLSFDVNNNTDTWTSVIDKSIEIWAMPEGQTLAYSVIPQTIAGGYALFASEILGSSLANLKDYEVEIGLVPYPLHSETQEDYAHYVDNHFYAYSVPTSVSDIDAIGDFLTIYAYHSTYLVRPAYLNVYAYDYCSDPQSAEMLDIILSTMTYDPGYLDASLEGDLSNMITNGKNNVAKFATAKAKNAASWITNFIAGLDDNNV